MARKKRNSSKKNNTASTDKLGIEGRVIGAFLCVLQRPNICLTKFLFCCDVVVLFFLLLLLFLRAIFYYIPFISD